MQNRFSRNPESPLCSDDILIRCMRSGDIAAGMRLKSIAGWNQTERDWKLFLDVNPDGCFVAECDGVVVGTVTTIVYEDRIAWIGMMLVDPVYRRQGIATRLMNHAVAWLGHDITIKLDATPLGKTVYDRLGFVEEYALCRVSADSVATDGVHPVDISPVSSSDAVGLALTALRGIAGKAVVIDAPVSRDDFLRRLYSCGFVEQRRLIRMYRGNSEFPGRQDMVFAIAGPELG